METAGQSPGGVQDVLVEDHQQHRSRGQRDPFLIGCPGIDAFGEKAEVEYDIFPQFREGRGALLIDHRRGLGLILLRDRIGRGGMIGFLGGNRGGGQEKETGGEADR
jgi:hypothetical protein